MQINKDLAEYLELYHKGEANAVTSREPDGSFNEDYCRWCYDGGTFKYASMDQLIDFCVAHMASEVWPAEQVRTHMEAVVPGLKHWKR